MRGSPSRDAGRSRIRLALLILSAVVLVGPSARAQYVLEDAHDVDRYSPGYVFLPFALYTQSFRFGGGVVWDSSGLIQPQSDLFAFAIGTTNGSYGFVAGEDDLQIPAVDRLFLDMEIGYFQYAQFTAFIDGNPHFLSASAGTNRSSERDFFQGHNDDSWGHFTLKYLLPIGGGRDVIVNKYVLEHGIVQSGATGGEGWNPLTTGRTYLQLTPFYEYQALTTPIGEHHFDELGLRFGPVYDNTDFPLNPSSGNITRITLSRDFGLFNDENTWTNVSAEFAQFINLGTSSLFRQQVLALDAWTSYSVTWSQHHVNHRRVVSGAPPFYDGAVLGGNERLRGFPDNRFWDRAAIYGTAELRLVPVWNPFGDFELLRKADITWMQWVIFGELGRVASKYEPNIFSHLKGDVGFGLRLLANDTVVRIDAAASSEGFEVWAAISQPF